MKKVNCFKNSGVNVMTDNAGEKKKILDGCKFCMEKRGCKCDKAEEMFNQPSLLSPYSPDNWVKYSAFVSEKPLDFPLKCYEYGPAFLRYCDDCQVVYETRHYMGALNENCPHCGKLGTPISDLYQDAYGPYLETDYYYTGFYTPCPYEKGLGCTSAYTENCRKNCFFHPFYIHDSETDTSAVKTSEEVKACAELVESIFCKQQHPTNEDYQRDVEFFRTYEADDAYSHYDIMEDFRVYFNHREIAFRLELAGGETAKFGEYNDLSEGYSIITDLYKVTIDGFEDYTTYCDSEDLLELTLTNLNGYMKINDKKSTADRVEFDSSIVKVRKNGKDVPFEFFKDGQGYHVKIE